MKHDVASSGNVIFPIGTVIAYAGPVTTAADGWLVCDGLGYPQTTYPDLYAAIGYTFGGTAPDFNVPLLSGKFARAVGTASGDAVGIEEEYATALPTKPFSLSIDNLGGSTSWYNTGKSEGSPVHNNQTTRNLTINSGGDLETVPVNKYVYYLIKASTLTAAGMPVIAPVGAVIAYTGIAIPDAANWTLCKGQTLTTQGQYSALFNAIGYTHGQVSSTSGTLMVLPDYQGYFLRGVDGGKNNDKTADSRTAPYPQGSEPGNAGDAVGSVQPMSTGLPTGAQFVVGIPQEPQSNNSNSVEGSSDLIGGATPLTAVALTAAGQGGDPETIPQNYAVDFYVATRLPATTNTDALPVGAVIMLACAPSNPPPGYLPCDGTAYPQASYEALYTAIQYLFGGNATAATFNVPDYRGYFLRGTDRTGKVDLCPRMAPANSTPVASVGPLGTYQAYATATPTLPFTGPIQVCNDITDVATTDNDNQTMDTATNELQPWTGGDAETRPINLHLAFYIKAGL